MTAFAGIVALPTPFPCSVCGSRTQVHHVHIEYRDGTSEQRTLCMLCRTAWIAAQRVIPAAATPEEG